jgi:hypothetical protein
VVDGVIVMALGKFFVRLGDVFSGTGNRNHGEQTIRLNDAVNEVL